MAFYVVLESHNWVRLSRPDEQAAAWDGHNRGAVNVEILVHIYKASMIIRDNSHLL